MLTSYIAYLAAAVVGDIPAAAASPKHCGSVEWKFGMKILRVYYQLFTYQLLICQPMFSCSNFYADPNFSREYLSLPLSTCPIPVGVFSKHLFLIASDFWAWNPILPTSGQSWTQVEKEAAYHRG